MRRDYPAFIIIVLVFAGILFSGCRIDDDHDDDPVDPNGVDITVSIDQSGIVIYTGQSFQFTATVQNTEDNGAAWSLSSTVNMDRGSISNDGLYMPVHIDVLSEDVIIVTNSTGIKNNDVIDVI